ncbi:MAG: Rne/Rng family ribonuclease [Clostridia bacterium]|nr:Rne/Rng family ribonuclease [Clostridia bacterium]MDE7329220.1 Rne/Rng family ribonuclease [Clostridia bacterium]
MKDILINVNPSDTQVCIVQDGELVEFWVERKNLTRLVGNIYKGRVQNVLNGMQAAFVNIGLEKNAFLFAGDTLEYGEILKDVTDKKLNLRAGDNILCQVTKEQFGSKGARITMNVTLPGRSVVLMPQIDYVGVSRKITDEQKKKELIEYASKIKPDGYGIILRTQSVDCTKEEMQEEVNELVEKWQKIKELNITKPAGSLIYKEEGVAIRAVRDMLRDDVDRIIINDKRLLEDFKIAFSSLNDKKPELFVLYEGKQAMLKEYGLNSQIEKLLQRKVVLANGAYLIIDRTEALTVIDVNTGKYVGEKNLEQTVFETNCIAAKEIARQLRVRNIGGIVVIDFIDMESQEHSQKVLETLQEALALDRTKTSVIGMTPLGLVEVTRKKTRSMLESVMLQTCPYCNGDGYVLSDEVMASNLKLRLNDVFSNGEVKSVLVNIAPSVFHKIFTYRLLEKECANEWRDKRIYLTPDEHLHIEKFDVKVLRGAIIDLPDNAKMLF